MDTVTRAVRSKIMSSIRSTSAMEVSARKIAISKAGCSLTHKPKGLMFKPDYANKGRMVVVFVHGCFWHQPCPMKCSKVPSSRRSFWKRKFERNADRHWEAETYYRHLGWRVITIWEHEVRQRRRVYGS